MLDRNKLEFHSIEKFAASAKGRENGNNPFPDGKPPVITVISPKKKTPAKKKNTPKGKNSPKTSTPKSKKPKKKKPRN